LQTVGQPDLESSVERSRHEQHKHEHDRPHAGREDAEERITGSGGTGEQGEASHHERDHVGRAGEQKQDRRSLGHPAQRRPALDQEPAAHGHAAHSAE